ncbi:phasin family protein [Sedimentitalea sp. JM2-8]|uniref:Phasin family protein n=1 Tax=Sedimentitalea xiamensis TaxID=3050037 RepID=A0ABT7FAA7_9RHOB|nr:phasin family protein [Sedimentitalea xiamensis]MDK3072042.1 phasin family protein [Sedimentitalea xiamensis]
MAKPNRQTPDAAASIADAIVQMQRHGLNSMSWMGVDGMERMRSLGDEAFNFLSERMKEDATLLHGLLHCRDLEELRRFQAEFIRTAIDQYTEATGRMIELGAAMVPGRQPRD